MKILAVNPGSTSTKIAVYEDETPRLVLNIRHSVEELSQFPRIIDQFEFRKHLVLEALDTNDIPFKFDAIAYRGGLLKPIPGGVYAVNDAMLDDMLHAMRTHACNLGCLIAHELAAMLPGCPSFIADPGVVDELDDVARITGSPLMPSITIWHALNQRAIARRYAAERSALQPEAPVHYEDLNLIVCHLGGGVSVGVHRHGRCGGRAQCPRRFRSFFARTCRHPARRATDRPLSLGALHYRRTEETYFRQGGTCRPFGYYRHSRHREAHR